MFHDVGRPPSAFNEWDQTLEEHIFKDIINYLKNCKNKGEGISLSKLAGILNHSPEKIEQVVRKYNGTWIDGVLNYVETPRGFYVVWGRVGEDPILCLHEYLDEVYEVTVKEGASLAICNKCGSRYILPGGKVEVDWSLNGISAPETINEIWGEPFKVSGRVLDFASKNGMPNVEVKVMLSRPPYWFWNCVGEGLTDYFGYFSIDLTEHFRRLQPGKYALSIDASFNGVEFVKVNDDWIHLNLTERPATPYQTRLSKSMIVDVSVRNTEGAPIKDCHVTLGSIKGLTDEYGNIQFRYVPPGCYELQADAPGYIPKCLKVELNEPYQHFNIVLERFDPLKHVVTPVLQVAGVVAFVTCPLWIPYVVSRILDNMEHGDN